MKNNFNSIYNPDYHNFAKLLFHIGTTLNGRKDRFDKADLIEQAFCQSCRGDKLEWRDDLGFDLIDPQRHIKFEVKSQTHCLFTPKRGNAKAKTSKIKLTNTLQQGEKKALNVTADWLIIIDSFNGAVGIVEYEQVVRDFSYEMTDGFGCQIPMDKVHILSRPKTVLAENVVSYKEQKKLMQESYVRRFFSNEN